MMKQFLVICTLCVAFAANTTLAEGGTVAKTVIPSGKESIWKELATIQVSPDPKTGFFNAVIPSELQMKNNQEVTIDGFIVPMDSAENSQHFMLSKTRPHRLTVMPKNPAERVELELIQPMTFTMGVVKVKGILNFKNDRQLGIFFVLKDAVVIPTENTPKDALPKNGEFPG